MDCKINDTKNMNKHFTTFVLLISTFCFAHAQDGYIKYHTDYEYRNKTVKVFKGEIVPFVNASKANRINLIIGADTITDLGIASKIFEVVTSANTTYNSQKADFLQLKKGGFVLVNATAIPNTDTVTLISESGKLLTQLIEKREAQVKQSELGKTCRLIISNSPSIFYSADQLKQLEEPEPVQQAESTETQTEEKKETGWALWQIILLSFIGLGIVGLGVWWFIKRRSSNPVTDKKAIYAVYNNNKSLSDFAKDNNIDLETLIHFNKGVIDKKFNGYGISKQKDVQKYLKNERLIVGYQEKSFVKTNDNFTNTETRNEPMTKEWDNPKETFVQPKNFGNNNELSSQLLKMEGTLIREIQRMSSGNSNQNEISKLRNDITELESKLKGVENDKKNSDLKQMQLQTEVSNLETNLQNVNDEKSRVQNEIKELKQRVIALDFLKGYSESVFTYLKYCQQVLGDAFSLFNKINQSNPEQALIPGQLLMKFQSNTISIPFGNWMQIAQDIKETGATTNKSLIYAISQFNSEEERKREFQRLIYTEVVTKYHSSILILAESFRNLERFQVTSESVKETQKLFSDHVTVLLSKASTVGLETKYVPLFKSFEDYPGLGESVNQKVSIAFRSVQGLEKNSVAEILLYGWKIEEGEEKTQFILA
jgi:hypothetical protein